MKHEIGDGFIAPIVRALQLRGVKFEWFCRVRDVVPDAGRGDCIGSIMIEKQLPDEERRKLQVFVTLPAGPNGRNPRARQVWPNRPVFEDGLRDPLAGSRLRPRPLAEYDSHFSPPLAPNRAALPSAHDFSIAV